jgi:lipoprotein-releasing system permease protein
MLKLFLWLRYLHKKKIVFLSIAAVALSVSLLIVVASLFTGFISALERAAVESIGDVVIYPPKKFAHYEQLIDRLEQIQAVDAATATISSYGLLHLGPGNVRAVTLWGIEPDRLAKVTGFNRFLRVQRDSKSCPSFDILGSPNEVGGFVGIGVLTKPDEQTDEYDIEAVQKMLGRQMVLTTGTVSTAAGADAGRAEFKRQLLKFTLADIVETGVYQFDSSNVYLPIEELQKVMYPNEKTPVAGEILVKLTDNTKSDVALAQIQGVWRSFVEEQLEGDPLLMQYTSIETAQQMQSRFIAAYLQQMNVLLVIFGVISFGVVMLVFCIFYMIVITKQKDIAIIKSCGASSLSVSVIFIGFGGCVGAVGSGVGIILGYIITKNINIIENWIRIVFGLKLWKSSVYLFEKIPNQVDWSSAVSMVFFAILAAAIGAVIPAVIAARTKPVEILRYE